MAITRGSETVNDRTRTSTGGSAAEERYVPTVVIRPASAANQGSIWLPNLATPSSTMIAIVAISTPYSATFCALSRVVFDKVPRRARSVGVRRDLPGDR